MEYFAKSVPNGGSKEEQVNINVSFVSAGSVNELIDT